MRTAIFFMLLLSAAGFALAAAPLRLVENSKSDYVIILPDHPSIRITLAAEELQKYLKKSTGVDLKTGIGEKSVILEIVKDLQLDESRVFSEGNRLHLQGGDDWGVLYAVYAFLERELGIRWFTPYGDEQVPKHPSLILEKVDYREKPAYKIRSLMCDNYYKNECSPSFFLRNRQNMGASAFLRKYGKHNLLSPAAHTLFAYIPPKKGAYAEPFRFEETKYYFANHPEYYSMNASGQRVLSLQLCFSNRDLRSELTKRVLEQIRKHPECDVFSVAAMDQPGGVCHCPGCKKLVEKYQAECGPLIDFLIELAHEVKKVNPEAKISTLAYRREQSEKPPVIEGKLPDNLVIVFAPIDNDFSKTMTHKNNMGTYNNLKGWTKIASEVWLWYYTYGMGMSEVSAIDTRLMYEAGATGTFYEHGGNIFTGQTFGDMRTWLLLQQFRNPEADLEALRKEFCDALYGAASADMIGYIRSHEKVRRDTSAYCTFCTGITVLFTPEQIMEWNTRFDRMEKAVSADPFRLDNVRTARIDLDLATLEKYLSIQKKFPGALPSQETIAQRVRTSVEKSLALRVPEKFPDVRALWRKRVLPQLDDLMIYAAVEPKALDQRFARIPPEKIRQRYAKALGGQCGFEKQPDAAFGQAIYDHKADVQLPFTCGFYDQVNKKFVLDRKIMQNEIIPDKYHLYKIGEAAITPSCTVWTMNSWRANIELGSLYIPGEGPNTKYEVWISLKFEGKGYHPESKATQNRVWFDRVVVIGK